MGVFNTERSWSNHMFILNYLAIDSFFETVVYSYRNMNSHLKTFLFDKIVRQSAIAPPTAGRVERIDAERLVDDHTHNTEHGRTAVLALGVQLERTYRLAVVAKSCFHLSHSWMIA